MARLVRKLYELGVVYMRFFSLPGDPRFFILFALLFRACFAHLYEKNIYAGISADVPE